MWGDGKCYEVIDSYCDEMYDLELRMKNGREFVIVKEDERERVEDLLVLACTVIEERWVKTYHHNTTLK